MNMRLLGFTLLAVLIVGGLIAGTFAHSIERVLTPPQAYGASQNIPIAKNSTPMTMTVTPTTTATPMPTGVLAQDAFQRTNQPLWGIASDGRAWEGDANSQNTFSITDMMGQIANGQGTFNALLGPASSNAEVVMQGSINHYHGDTVNLGIVLRWTNGNNWYKILIDGTSFIVLKRVNGTSTPLAIIPFNALGGRFYTLRFRAVGATLFAKAWRSSFTEPDRWMVVVNDTSLTSGQAGIRVLMQNDTVVHIASFLETAASSGM